jgi:hypothetical protein
MRHGIYEAELICKGIIFKKSLEQWRFGQKPFEQ